MKKINIVVFLFLVCATIILLIGASTKGFVFTVTEKTVLENNYFVTWGYMIATILAGSMAYLFYLKKIRGYTLD